MLDSMPRVAKILGTSGSTLADVHDALKAEGMSEYDIYLTVKGAAMCYPHVREALTEESIPSTVRQ
jgi:hypothetical protein